MRNAITLDILLDRFPEQYDFLRKKLYEVDDNGIRKFFLGFRSNSIELYYKAMCVAKISYDNKKDMILYENDPYYLEKTGKKSPLQFEDIKQEEIFDSILNQIEKHVYGEHGVKHKHQREKDCQQWIVNANNMNSKEWFFIDMEYVYKENPCGRIDMIAIKREPNEKGKHEIAFVELKVRHGEYNGFKTAVYKKSCNEYEKARKDIHNPEVRTLKYGSGIVSHIADYLRMLGESDFIDFVRQELVEMIRGNVTLGLIDKEAKLAGITDSSKLYEIPSIYILTYAYVPIHADDIEKYTNIRSSKRSLYNKIYSVGTEYGLSEMLRRDQIAGILEDKEEFQKFIKDDNCMILRREQKIKGINYPFVFEFVIPDRQPQEMWKCLQ